MNTYILQEIGKRIQMTPAHMKLCLRHWRDKGKISKTGVKFVKEKVPTAPDDNGATDTFEADVAARNLRELLTRSLITTE